MKIVLVVGSCFCVSSVLGRLVSLGTSKCGCYRVTLSCPSRGSVRVRNNLRVDNLRYNNLNTYSYRSVSEIPSGRVLRCTSFNVRPPGREVGCGIRVS